MAARIPLVINSGAIQELQSGDSLNLGSNASLTSPTIAASMTLSYGTANQVQFLNGSKQLVGDADLTFDGTTLSTTNFTSSGNITLSGGTANGVAYLNGSKVLTSGSALTFDGSNFLRITGSSNTYLGITSGGGKTGYYGVDTQGMTLETGANDPIKFSCNGSEQMRLTSTGLGIGTSSPGAKLNVSASGNSVLLNGSGTAANFLRLTSNGADGVLGVDSSTGASIVTGSSAYATVLYTVGSTPLQLGTNSTIKATLDSSGNLGLGVTPSAWGGDRKVIQLGLGADINGSASSASFVEVGANFYNIGANDLYKSSDYAEKYRQYQGQHQFYTAPSGTAGNAISFTQAMTLDASGYLGVGTTSPASYGKLAVVDSGDVAITVAATSAGSTLLNLYPAGGGYAGVAALGATVPLVFRTNSAERMRIDSSGNVGIGISAPTDKFTLNAGNFGLVVSGGGASQFINFRNAGGTIIQQIEYSDADGSLNFGGTGGGGYPLKFSSNGTERMRIDSSGVFMLGSSTAVASSFAGVRFNGATYNGLGLNDSSATSGAGYVYFQSNGTTIGSITRVGTTSVIAYNTSSDYRLKENVQPMLGALDTISKLNPVTYTWKADGSDGQGFIAHELQAVVPDCVTGAKDAVDEEGKPVYQGIDTSFLVATLTKAIQELKAELDATKAEVAALKGN